MGYYKDSYVKNLEEEIAFLAEMNKSLQENNDQLRHHIDMLRGEAVNIESLCEEDEEGDGFFTDDDYKPGTLRMNFKRKGRKAEIITPRYKEKIEGFTFELTPRDGFELNVRTRKVPRK